MSETFQVKMPKLGESIVSATIVSWFKKVGDTVSLDEPLLEVSTDKVNSEIPSPVAGVITEISAKPDETYDVDAVLCVISTSGSAPAQKEAPVAASSAGTSTGGGSMRGFFSPAVLRFARENGIGMDELDAIEGSGAGGRLSRKDVEQYLSGKGGPGGPAQERVKMTGMRKAIAEHMVKSFYEAPHASLVIDVDVTDVMNHIKANKEAFIQQHGCKPTITSYIVKAIAAAAMKYPYINASLDGDEIVLKKFVNVGIAVSVDQAVVVPVIRGVHQLGIPQIAKKVAELGGKARDSKLSPDDVQEGTITMTNFGMGGAIIGVPIIRFPEVAIVGVGKIQKVLSVMDDESTAVRSKVNLSLTFDHRAIDGMYGCEFLSEVKAQLEASIKS